MDQVQQFQERARLFDRIGSLHFGAWNQVRFDLPVREEHNLETLLQQFGGSHYQRPDGVYVWSWCSADDVLKFFIWGKDWMPSRRGQIAVLEKYVLALRSYRNGRGNRLPQWAREQRVQAKAEFARATAERAENFVPGDDW